MPITYVASGSVPADNGSNATATITPSLPTSSMEDGDLILLWGGLKSNQTETITLTTTGGLTWSSVQDYSNGSTGMTIKSDAAIYFSSSYTSDPTYTYSATTSTSLFYIILRPPNNFNLKISIPSIIGAISYSSGINIKPWTWVPASTNFNNFTNTSTIGIDIPLINNYRTSNGFSQFSWQEVCSVFVWYSTDDNTWGNLTQPAGGNFEKTNLSAQYRNLASTDSSFSVAYSLNTRNLSGTVSQDQLTLGSDPAFCYAINFYWINQSGLIAPSIGHPF